MRVHVTDASNASRTMLFNIHTGLWDDELLRLLNVPRSVLPDVKSSSGVMGESTGDLFGGPIKIAGNAGDQQAALFGQTCFVDGLAKNTYGTGCFMLMNVGTKAPVSRHKLLATVAWNVQGSTEYALEGSVFIGGAVVQWLRDGLGLVKSAADIEPLAASVPDPGGVYIVPAFAGLGAPHWDQYARGTITGITREQPPPTSPVPAWRASPIRSPTFSTSCRTMPRCTSASCAWTAAPVPIICSCNFKPICCAFQWFGPR